MENFSKRSIFIDYNKPGAVRIAVVEDGKLKEIIAERVNSLSVVGNIYAGIIKNILPSQFMFVDIGDKKNVFIHLNDKREAGLLGQNGKCTVKIGDTLLIQVIKDAAGEKGMFGTSRISFTGMFFVVSKSYNPTEIGASRKLDNPEERERLKQFVRKNLPPRENYDVIIRTKSEGCDENTLCAELKRLISLCKLAETEWRYVKAPALVYNDGKLIEKVFRELYCSNVDKIVLNNAEQFSAIKSIVPVAPNILEFYNETENDLKLFQKYGIEPKIQKALNKRVWLPSGGFLIIEKTEACFVIDVNTGKFAGAKGHEQSVLKVNIEAAAEIAVQLRLRNMSGIIIVDFIDMKSEKSKTVLLEKLREELKNDRLSVSLIGMTELGLVQITRKKTREPIENILN